MIFIFFNCENHISFQIYIFLKIGIDGYEKKFIIAQHW